MSIINTAKTLLNPTTWNAIQTLKEVADAIPEVAKPSQKLLDAKAAMLVIARKELDDTAEAVGDLYALAKPLFPPTATESEVIDSVLLLTVFALSLPALAKA
jgi:hypothetical protein